MIEIIDGPVGCGKTLVTMWFMLNQWLPSGVQLATNVPINRDGMRQYTKKKLLYDFDDRQIVTFADKDIETACIGSPEGSKLVIDEASLPFDAADTKTANRKTREFFALSRHYHQDVWFIAQHSDNMDVRIRRMANNFYHVQDMRDYPLPLIGIHLHLPLAYVVKWNKTHTVELSSEFIGHDKLLYATYDSFAKHGTVYGKIVQEYVKPVLVPTPLYKRLYRAEVTYDGIKKAIKGGL